MAVTCCIIPLLAYFFYLRVFSHKITQIVLCHFSVAKCVWTKIPRIHTEKMCFRGPKIKMMILLTMNYWKQHKIKIDLIQKILIWFGPSSVNSIIFFIYFQSDSKNAIDIFILKMNKKKCEWNEIIKIFTLQ